MANRRYKVGEHPEYDKTFDRLTIKSLILNPGGKTSADIQNFGTYHMLQSKEGIERLLEEWRGEAGDIKRAYMLGRREVPSKLAEAEMQVEKINAKFDKLKQDKINSGHYPPKKMPNEMRKELLKAEAVEDIVKAEIKRLENALEKFPAGGIETHEMPCLPRGPEGMGKKRKGILRWLDGQDVFPDPEGVLRIKDNRTPYNGMMTAEYFKYIVKPYKQAQAKLLSEYEIEVSRAREEGTDPASIVKRRPPLPDWPENVKHYEWKE